MADEVHSWSSGGRDGLQGTDDKLTIPETPERRMPSTEDDLYRRKSFMVRQNPTRIVSDSESDSEDSFVTGRRKSRDYSSASDGKEASVGDVESYTDEDDDAPARMLSSRKARQRILDSDEESGNFEIENCDSPREAQEPEIINISDTESPLPRSSRKAVQRISSDESSVDTSATSSADNTRSESAYSSTSGDSFSAADIRRSLEQKQKILRSVNPKNLPDNGARLKQQIAELETQLVQAEQTQQQPKVYKNSRLPAAAPGVDVKQLPTSIAELQKELQVKRWAMGTADSQRRALLRGEIAQLEEALSRLQTNPQSTQLPKDIPVATLQPAFQQPRVQLLPEILSMPADIQRRMYADHNVDKLLYMKGRLTASQRREAANVTYDSLESLHRSLATCPAETETEETPKGLLVELLLHQKRALKWLLWRETQSPSGGILADDMGLGKTLTMISLIFRHRELLKSVSEEEVPKKERDWLARELKIKKTNATLIVCPPSVIGQWETELKAKCKPGSVSVVTYHGPDRSKSVVKFSKVDVVLTTYQTISREVSTSESKTDADMGPIADFDEQKDADEIRKSPLLQFAWERIILDEAHVIRNPKTQVAQGVCRLRAARRWVVSGTPVQNKLLDMYSLLRFLRVSPFDQLAVWKRWVECKSAQGTERMNLLIKTLLLRRTKDQTCEDTGKPLVAMPSREVHTHKITLSPEENEVYQKILDFSRQALEQYLKSQQEKEFEEAYGHRPSGSSRTATGPKPPKDVTRHHLLVLLLRLRQACSHPGLLRTMLDSTDAEQCDPELASSETQEDVDIISKMASMTLAKDSSGNKQVEEKDFFLSSNPVFSTSNSSSKLNTVLQEVARIVERGQKAVIVSQWTSMLQIFEQHLKKCKLNCRMIAGNVPVKERTAIVNDFNSSAKGTQIILLSLGAGGVGLNLIGGNHLFLTDMHWNPQLEAQACDRIYRVGQTKDVHIHRFVTLSTVEERIVDLQKRKLALANGILTGAKNLQAQKLTLEDLKLLFQVAQPR